MTEIYEGVHSLIISGKNTWDDFHLIPTSLPVVSMPEFSSKMIEIPGRFGKINHSYMMTGAPVYLTRTGSWEFILDPDRVGDSNWAGMCSDIATYIHGREHNVILTDDSDYYYHGVLTLEEINPEKMSESITINYELDPFKMPNFDPLGDWLWDPFNFETDNAYDITTVSVSGSKVVATPDLPFINRPVISYAKASNSSTMKVSYGGRTYSLKDGVNYMNQMILSEGISQMTFTGSGYLQISYRGCKL